MGTEKRSFTHQEVIECDLTRLVYFDGKLKVDFFSLLIKFCTKQTTLMQSFVKHLIATNLFCLNVESMVYLL